MKKNKGFRVRFHLGAGIHFMHWQIKDLETDQVTFVDPGKMRIRMDGCKLKNNKKTAEKIHEGANKTVCAWVECQWVSTFDMDAYIQSPDYNPLAAEYLVDTKKWVSFNPRVCSSWMDDSGSEVDGKMIRTLVTCGKRIFFPVS